MFTALFKKNHANKYKYFDGLVHWEDMPVKKHGCIIISSTTIKDEQLDINVNQLEGNINQNNTTQQDAPEKRRYYFVTQNTFNEIIKKYVIDPRLQTKQINAVDASSLTKEQINIFVDEIDKNRFKSDEEVQILEDANNNLAIFDGIPWKHIDLNENTHNNENLHQKTTGVINRIIDRTDRTQFKMVGKGKEYTTKNGKDKYITKGTKKMINKLKKLESLGEAVTQKEADEIGEEIIDVLLPRIEPSWKRAEKTAIRHKQALCDVTSMMSACGQWKIPQKVLSVEPPTPATTPEPLLIN